MKVVYESEITGYENKVREVASLPGRDVATVTFENGDVVFVGSENLYRCNEEIKKKIRGV